MWYVAAYQQTALFSLRQSLSTSSGETTLLIPTPFALKMALLDAAIRTQGKEQATLLFPILRDLQVAVRLPEQMVIIKSFLKIVRPKKHGSSDDTGSGLQTPLGSSIANREFVFYSEPFGLALSTQDSNSLSYELVQLLAQINYIGKRGSFIQLLSVPQQQERLDEQWTVLTTPQTRFFMDGTLQMLDDCGAKLRFEQVDVTSGIRLVVGKDRIQRAIVLPCRQVQYGRGFTLFQHIHASEIREGDSATWQS
ncbi:hypothetical protein [Dictyobacter formicarum]|uniref:Uncharacterized protein n=1 Tax=Dictyobacter formicarum TaxID=2778368 RepID=A0ABQ3VTD0_9CHLR|nr:hypothetical protein [Dictyobacter formicarum]GHO88884.1 hypothetical protein KSZ_68900 [Dictyobacter formicarum]